jgi:hypothetical protein
MARFARPLALASFLLVSFATAGHAQVWWDVHGGVTSSVLTGDVTGSPDERRGFHVGGGVRVPMGFLGFDTEVNYIQRGLTRDQDDASSQAIGANGMTYALAYWEWNGLVRLRLPGGGGLGPALLGGMGVSRLQSEKLTIDGGPQDGTSDPETLTGHDMTMILGVSLDLGDGDGRWFIDARFAKSLMNVADAIQFIGTDTPNYRNRTLSISLGRVGRIS